MHNESHALEIADCKVSFNQCPRREGAIGLGRNVQRYHYTFIANRTEENRIKYQDARNKLAWYFGQEPLKVIHDCFYCGKDGDLIKIAESILDGFHDYCNKECYDKGMASTNGKKL